MSLTLYQPVITASTPLINRGIVRANNGSTHEYNELINLLKAQIDTRNFAQVKLMLKKLERLAISMLPDETRHAINKKIDIHLDFYIKTAAVLGFIFGMLLLCVLLNHLPALAGASLAIHIGGVILFPLLGATLGNGIFFYALDRPNALKLSHYIESNYLVERAALTGDWTIFNHLKSKTTSPLSSERKLILLTAATQGGNDPIIQSVQRQIRAYGFFTSPLLDQLRLTANNSAATYENVAP